MKILFIGGTGNISMACTRLALEKGMEVYHLNRGTNGMKAPSNVVSINADIKDNNKVKNLLKDLKFDVVANFIAFKPEDVERDFELFSGKTKQYIFISSASAYQKPLLNPVVTESTPLKNPYWQYSRDKIACENRLQELSRDHDFPMTIIRPSLTYETVIPTAIGGWTDYTIIDRIKKGKAVVVHGDGTSLWTITHSKDFAVGFIGLCGNQQAIGDSFHITSDEILTWNQIYEAVGEAAGVKTNMIHITSEFICKVTESVGQDNWGNLLGDKAVSTIFDNSKIKRLVPEFNATITFKEGIKETLKWFEADPKRMKLNEESDQLLDLIIEKYSEAMRVI
jgi:nucleoside-diphosphate-sugar epimerase